MNPYMYVYMSILCNQKIMQNMLFWFYTILVCSIKPMMHFLRFTPGPRCMWFWSMLPPKDLERHLSASIASPEGPSKSSFKRLIAAVKSSPFLKVIRSPETSQSVSRNCWAKHFHIRCARLWFAPPVSVEKWRFWVVCATYHPPRSIIPWNMNVFSLEIVRYCY